MDNNEMKVLLEQAKKNLNFFLLVEDKDFIQALLNGKIKRRNIRKNRKKC